MRERISLNRVREASTRVMSELPDFWKEFRRPQLPRVCEEISWIYVEGGTVVDLGGGPGFHASICSCLGMKAISVDNFRMLRPGTICDHFLGHNASAEEAASRLGVEFIHVDLVDWEPPFQEDSLDVVMSFDNIEHLSHSPRRVYTHMIRCLKPGGMVLIGAPNAANLAKRVRMVLGRNVFARMDEWYMHDGFIGHIREPIVSDLRLIAEDLGIHVEAVVGRNWLGLSKLQGRMQLCGNLLDRALRCHPAFCSDIYLLATKPR